MPTVISDHFPHLPISLSVVIGHGDASLSDFRALVDTGFTGDIVIPGDWVAKHHLPPPPAHANWTMADGSEVMTPMYRGFIQFPAESTDRVEVSVVALGGKPLVGRGVIDQLKLTLDHEERIILEP